MVQISNTLIIAAAVVPALAAPVLNVAFDGRLPPAGLTRIVRHRELDLEAREPITGAQAKAIVKGAGEIAHHAQSGIEFGAAVAPLFPHKQRREFDAELETREPGGRLGRPKQKRSLETREPRGALGRPFQKSITAIAPLVQQRREFDAEVETREPGGRLGRPTQNSITAVAPLKHMRRREFDAELETREPGGRLGRPTQHSSTAPAFGPRKQIREFDAELETREPGGRLGRPTQHSSTAPVFGPNKQKREFDVELETREPGGRLGRPKQKRSLEDLEARGKFHVSSSNLKAGGGAAAAVAGFAGTVALMNTQPHRRDFDELDARDPKFSFGKILGVASHFIRDEETGELYVREYDDAELDAREPKFPFGLIKGVAKLVLRETPEINQLD